MLRFSVEILAQIALSFYLQSAWGLVLGVIVAAVFEVGLSFVMCQEKPVFHYLRSRGSEILRNARWLSISSALHYLGDNIDDFIIGKLLGTHTLGIYHNGYALSHKSNYEFAKSAHHSLMPVFSKIDQRTEKARLRKAFYRSFWSLTILVTLISLPLFIFPELLIRVLLGEQWLEAATILPVLVFAGLIHALVNLGYALIVAKKQYLYLNGHLFLSLALLIIGIILGNHYYGLLGAVWGIALSRILSAPIVFLGVRKCLA
jgi:O-antigen/teichoic acid export membrane protein